MDRAIPGAIPGAIPAIPGYSGLFRGYSGDITYISLEKGGIMF